MITANVPVASPGKSMLKTGSRLSVLLGAVMFSLTLIRTVMLRTFEFASLNMLLSSNIPFMEYFPGVKPAISYNVVLPLTDTLYSSSFTYSFNEVLATMLLV